MAPAMQASPMTWMFGADLESKVTGSIAHQPVLSVAPAISAMRPARCGGMTLATWAVWLPKSVIMRVGRGIDDVHLAALRQRHPFDHSRIELLPGVLEQALLGKGVLGVEDEQLRARLFGLQIMRDQAGALVRSPAGSGRDWRAPRSPPGRHRPWLRVACAAAASARRLSRHAASSRPRLRHSPAARRSAGRRRATAPAGRRRATCRRRGRRSAPAASIAVAACGTTVTPPAAILS